MLCERIERIRRVTVEGPGQNVYKR
jgi:hypothetical protein